MKVFARIEPLRECDYNFNTWFKGIYESEFNDIVKLVFPTPADFVCNRCMLISIESPNLKNTFVEYPEFRKCLRNNTIQCIAILDANWKSSEIELEIEYTKYSREQRMIDLLHQITQQKSTIILLESELNQIMGESK
jgi:hypothetical protein